MGQSWYRVRDAGVDSRLALLLVARKTSKSFCNNKYRERKFNENGVLQSQMQEKGLR